MIVVFFVGILGLLIGVGVFLEQKLLVCRKKIVPIPELPPAFDGIRIVQISDLHKKTMGKQNQRLLELIAEQAPDLIFITGDLVSRDARDFSERLHFLKKLREIAPVFLCLGNHEMDLPRRGLYQFRRMAALAGCRLLENATVPLERDGERMYIAGASLKQSIYRDKEGGYRHLESYTPEELTKALGRRRGCTILLAHNPLMAETYFSWGADLTLTGHMHGGVVRLPLIGGLLSPERKLFPKYSKGWYEEAGHRMYVNCGIGKFRVGNPAEVAFMVLMSGK